MAATAILKERLFGLNGEEGNHGEDVKDYCFYLDNTPTHSYMKYLYKYPQAAFPYEQLRAENRRRTRNDPEFELLDTGVFAENRYFDVFAEYAKAAPDDILIRITVWNRGPEAAPIHVLPTIWFRNTWSWTGRMDKPGLRLAPGRSDAVELAEPYYGKRWLTANRAPEWLFTENESDNRALWGSPNLAQYLKDGIGRCVVDGERGAVNPASRGTKAAAHYSTTVAAGASATFELRLTDSPLAEPFGEQFSHVFAERIREADEFYSSITPPGLSEDGRAVMRQALAGLLWSKQFYHYVVRDWLDGDPAFPAPPDVRRYGRNHEWIHLYNSDVISMPDKWEYPWWRPS